MGIVTFERPVFDRTADTVHRVPIAERLFALAATVARRRDLVTHAVVLGTAAAASLVVVVS